MQHVLKFLTNNNQGFSLGRLERDGEIRPSDFRSLRGQAGQDNSRSPQMFTSIFRGIFEEARSKRVWSISSTFEYESPSLSLCLSRFFRYLLLAGANETTPAFWISLHELRKEPRETSREEASRQSEKA